MPDDVFPLALPTVKPNVLPVNWAQPVRLETLFNVDTSISHVTGVEQRRLLGDRPVRTQVAKVSGLDRKRSAMILGNLFRAASQKQPVPLYCDESVVTTSSSGSTLTCPTAYRRFFVGGRVLVFHFDGDGLPTGAEYKFIDAVGAGALTIRSPGLALTHPVGSVVYPCIDAELNLAPGAISLRNDAIGETDFTWLENYGPSALPVVGSFGGAVPGFSNYSPPGEAPEGSLPILHIIPNWADDPVVTITRPGERFAAGRGNQVETYLPRPLLSFVLQFLERDRATSWDLIKFWHSRLGTYLPFMLPNPQVTWTFRQTSGSTQIWIEPYGNAEDINDFVKYVVVRSTANVLYPCKMSSCAVSGDHFVITVDAIPAIADVAYAEVTSLHMVRFRSDALGESWLNSEICNLTFEAIEIVEEIDSEILNIEVLT